MKLKDFLSFHQLILFTFLMIDTFHERNRLMVDVYPKLKDFCQEYGYQFQVIIFVILEHVAVNFQKNVPFLSQFIYIYIYIYIYTPQVLAIKPILGVQIITLISGGWLNGQCYFSVKKFSVIGRRNFSVLAAVQIQSISYANEHQSSFCSKLIQSWSKNRSGKVDDNDSWLYNEN